jgi:hypothetical protein
MVVVISAIIPSTQVTQTAPTEAEVSQQSASS